MPAGTCSDCGIERWKLHRHHVIPKSQGGSNDEGNLVRICANCHEDRHGPNGEVEPWRLANTPEARAKRSESMRRLWADPEFREKMVAIRRQQFTPEVRQRMGAGVQRALREQSPEQRAEHGRKISATKTGRTLKGDRWALAWDACRGCGTTTKPHAGEGYCGTCRYRVKHGIDPSLPPIIHLSPALNRWARYYDACIGCGTTDRRHSGHGLCESCRQSARSGHLTIGP